MDFPDYQDFKRIRNIYLETSQGHAEDVGVVLSNILDGRLPYNTETIDKMKTKLHWALDQLSQASALASLQYLFGRNINGEGNENFNYDKEK
jgi:hypothetical protein